jgi:hypothetical protein
MRVTFKPDAKGHDRSRKLAEAVHRFDGKYPRSRLPNRVAADGKNLDSSLEPITCFLRRHWFQLTIR